MTKQIENEHRRQYTYPDGAKYEVHDAVSEKNVPYPDYGANGHLIVDARGWTHEIAPGWRTLVKIPKKQRARRAHDPVQRRSPSLIIIHFQQGIISK
ncbi:hypothetical protein [Mesorhizobium sp. M4B.F.Ca.ET.058.02.1.1]|uniref:hypothetical protein n=1 Tax=Mesorhizobium sp. M4B.F.Ca.ET.058.02.1.1 TaxID=2493675 RepID=UPI000F760E3E|nr:hypothetical protein [Mesorhizobium sp. M4B.F.Ca.ET.058.02.1.1]AZO48060.1 hypothetical protein EJ073_09705 [Mesorhizobium sp. M4B.F.Ca.ET.058.02.1.1]